MKYVLLSAALAVFATSALAENAVYEVTLKDHVFTPNRVEVPANTAFKLKVKNLDGTPEEFESHDLKREKIVPANGEITVNIGALKPGEYKFFGEFNEDTAQGVVVAK